MSLSFEEVLDWAIDRATDWALDANGDDRLAIGDLRPAWPLRVEAFNLLMPLASAVVGRPSDHEGTGLKGALKRRGADRAVRLLGLALRAGLRTPAPATPVQVAFISELATPSSLEPMLAVAGELPSEAFRPISADPRATRAWQGAGSDPLPLIHDWPRAIRARGRTVASARRRWVDLANRPRRFDLAGRDVTADALARLEPLVRRSVPWLAAEQSGLAARLDQLRPGWLVLASDQHRIGRLAVGLARDRGIRTIVLQHGLPQSRIGFLPVVANEVVTWSPASDAWFLDGGAPPERLVRLGNPRLDELARTDRDSVAEDVARTHRCFGRPRLLLTLSPNDLERNVALLALALDWLRSEPDASLIVKLHPGAGHWDAVRAGIAADAAHDRVRLTRHEPLYPLLRWADLVLLHRSTVAVEALAAGTPVAVGAVGPPADANPLPEDLDLPEVADADGLRALARSVVDATARVQFIAARRSAVERTTGPLDGRVAERIARHLLAPGAG